VEILTDPETWIALATLTALEIVLGIDNVVFISILSSRLPPEEQARARRVGLGLAMLMRILLLLTLAVIVRLTAPIFVVAGNEISGRDVVLILGGLFLLYKSTHEIHVRLEGESGGTTGSRAVSFVSVITQIALLDIVFSLDSVITAVGMVDEVPIMIAAVVLAVIVMLVFAGPISDFVERHPTVKILALSFLLMIGVALIADGFDLHIPKGYIYFAMAFSLGVELINLRVRSRSAPVELRSPYAAEDAIAGKPSPGTADSRQDLHGRP
jgi:predicted tellurium resistance membrane protein TerC